MSIENPNLKKVVGYGWSGLWFGEEKPSLGWQLSHYISDGHSENLNDFQKDSLGLGETNNVGPCDMYRVKVTIEIVRNKKTGKPIVRRTQR